MDRLAIAYLIAGLFGFGFLLLLVDRRLRRAAARFRARRRSRRARRGELEAEALLARQGFTIVDRQAALSWSIGCDGEEVPVDLRADMLVERDGRRLVAEVKTGESAPQISNAATRRQLLEYFVAYRVDGILLVDAEAATISEIQFPLPDSPELPPEPRSRATIGLAAAAAGVAVGLSLGLWLAG